MSRNLKFFLIPVKDFDAYESELNSFLDSVRVVNINRNFVDQGQNSFVFHEIEYRSDSTGEPDQKSTSNSKPRIDYKKVLSDDDFALYSKLREWRNDLATKKGMSFYVIFDNKQIAEIAKKRISEKSELIKISGIGEGKVSKYGDDVIKIVEDVTAQQNSETQKDNPLEKIIDKEVDESSDVEQAKTEEKPKDKIKKEKKEVKNAPGGKSLQFDFKTS